jgi:hypothetical protein
MDALINVIGGLLPSPRPVLLDYVINRIITRRGSQQAIVAMHANFEGRIK